MFVSVSHVQVHVQCSCSWRCNITFMYERERNFFLTGSSFSLAPIYLHLVVSVKTLPKSCSPLHFGAPISQLKFVLKHTHSLTHHPLSQFVKVISYMQVNQNKFNALNLFFPVLASPWRACVRKRVRTMVLNYCSGSRMVSSKYLLLTETERSGRATVCVWGCNLANETGIENREDVKKSNEHKVPSNFVRWSIRTIYATKHALWADINVLLSVRIYSNVALRFFLPQFNVSTWLFTRISTLLRRLLSTTVLDRGKLVPAHWCKQFLRIFSFCSCLLCFFSLSLRLFIS